MIMHTNDYYLICQEMQNDDWQKERGLRTRVLQFTTSQQTQMFIQCWFHAGPAW